MPNIDLTFETGSLDDAQQTAVARELCFCRGNEPIVFAEVMGIVQRDTMAFEKRGCQKECVRLWLVCFGKAFDNCVNLRWKMAAKG